MMNSGNWEAAPSYTTVEMLLDDVSKQMASSNINRYSHGSQASTRQMPGGSMRIVKPSSTSNSPRGSMGLGRRRTVMNDGAYRKRLAMMDQAVIAAGGYVSNDGLQVPTKSTRPVSWHPASNPQQPMYQAPYSAPVTNPQYQYFDIQPTPTYSAYASPDSAFSSVSTPFSAYEQQTYYQPQTTSFPSNTSYPTNQTFFLEQPAQSFVQAAPTNTDPTMYSHFDWNNFSANGFESTNTSPPTPENFLPIQHPDPTFTTEESIPYHSLSDTDSDDGEELIGMGLYDGPKTPAIDPQLDQYRSLMASHLVGTPPKTERSGKGLKLEETWQPPASDDEDDDDEQDGEGEEDDEPTQHIKAEPAPTVAAPPYQLNLSYPPQHVQAPFTNQAYNYNGWV